MYSRKRAIVEGLDATYKIFNFFFFIEILQTTWNRTRLNFTVQFEFFHTSKKKKITKKIVVKLEKLLITYRGRVGRTHCRRTVPIT